MIQKNETIEQQSVLLNWLFPDFIENVNYSNLKLVPLNQKTAHSINTGKTN